MRILNVNGTYTKTASNATNNERTMLRKVVVIAEAPDKYFWTINLVIGLRFISYTSKHNRFARSTGCE